MPYFISFTHLDFNHNRFIFIFRSRPCRYIGLVFDLDLVSLNMSSLNLYLDPAYRACWINIWSRFGPFGHIKSKIIFRSYI